MSNICELCHGEDYFQKDPDCRNCPVFIDGDCEGQEHNLCVVRSVCPECNGTGEQQTTNEEIRQAFDREFEKDHFELHTEPDTERDYAEEIFQKGYKARDKSAQTEIENIKEWNAKVFKKKEDRIKELEQLNRKLQENMKKVSEGTSHIVINRDKKIKRLEQEAKDASVMYQSAPDNIHKELECCGNCGNECDGFERCFSNSKGYGLDNCNWKQRSYYEKRNN